MTKWRQQLVARKQGKRDQKVIGKIVYYLLFLYYSIFGSNIVY